MEQDFIHLCKEPPREYSALAFWFWNGTLEPEKLKKQIDMMCDQGVYGAFMHARAYLRTPYLEEDWWKAVDACLKEGQARDFHPWLYDEYAWPSGTAGSTFEYGYQKPSRVLKKGDCNRAKALEAVYPESMTELEALFADRRERLKGIYLTEGDGDALSVKRFSTPQELSEQIGADFPAGRIICFVVRVLEKSVDYLNRDAIRDFLDSTHEKYSERYGQYFGNLIPGIFFDEIYMAGRPFPWTDSFAEAFSKRHGYDLLESLPFLLEEKSKKGRKLREDYYDTAAALYEEAFFSQIGTWCKEHHLLLTGHTEEELIQHPGRQGNYFRTMRHLMIPGADCHDYRYRLPRKISFHESKYSVSVARAYGKERAMSEAMGGAGWGCSLQEYRRGIHTLGAMGINMFILHGFYYECDHQGSQGDWPASFFYQNPYWKYFKNLADEIRRISFLNTVGVPVVQVGLYYPIREMQAGSPGGRPDEGAVRISEAFHRTQYALIEDQIDVDVLDEDTLLTAPIEKGCLISGGRRFRVLLFPEAMEQTAELRAFMERYEADGGNILFYACGTAAGKGKICAPECAPGAVSERIRRDIEIVAGDRSEIYVNHRKIGGWDSFYISNSEDIPKRTVFHLNCLEDGKRVFYFSPATGKMQPVKAEQRGQDIFVELKLKEDEACCLFVTDGNRESGEEKTQRCAGYQIVTGLWDFLPLSEEYDEWWDDQAKETEMEIPVALFSSPFRKSAESVRICNTSWEAGSCGRHMSLWNASWITFRNGWREELAAADLYFRYRFTVPGEIHSAVFCIAAVGQYTLYINGESAATGEGYSPVTLSAADYLHAGDNVIAVHLHNPNPYLEGDFGAVEELPPDRLISLLFEGKVQTAGTHDTIHVCSDESWLVSDRYQAGWKNPDSELMAGRYDAAHDFFPNMRADWLHAWERGKPPMLPWGDLPLYGEEMTWPVEVTYQITLPAGTAGVYAPAVSGEYSCRIDGKDVSFALKTYQPLEVTARTVMMELRVRVSGPGDGLTAPVRVTLKPVKTGYGEWAAKGLSWFSGRVMYANSFLLDTGGKNRDGHKSRYVLKWGQSNSCAEVWINHRLAGVCTWAPYEVDITEYVAEGENDIAIIVANLAAPARKELLVDEGKALGWNRYWNEDNINRESEDLISGLMGPVRIYRYK